MLELFWSSHSSHDSESGGGQLSSRFLTTFANRVAREMIMKKV
jgi:hypothetical protein